MPSFAHPYLLALLALPCAHSLHALFTLPSHFLTCCPLVHVSIFFWPIFVYFILVLSHLMYASYGNENLFDEDYNRDKKYSQQLEKYPNKYAIY
jgi:hypothetical protein